MSRERGRFVEPEAILGSSYLIRGGGFVAVANSASALIRVEAQDAADASAIVRTLVAVFGGDVSLDADTFQVEVRPLGDSDRAVARAVDALEAWLPNEGRESVLIHVAGHRYRIEARTRPSASEAA
jgi:hypothetical protein